MLLKKTTRGMYRYKGIPDSFYHKGEEYYLTIVEKRTLKGKHLEVTCRRGGKDQLYEGCTPIVYGDEGAFRSDWEPVNVKKG